MPHVADAPDAARRRRRWWPVVLLSLAGSCSILPDELNLSPIYRHRVDPDGRLVELDLLWPLVHWEKDAAGTTDLRLRPLWRRVHDAVAERTVHEFLVPFGEGRARPDETVWRLLPLFYYREHLHEGEPGAWDRDWFFTPLLWGGSSAGGEDYLALFPIWGSIPQFLSYDRFSFFLFPLSLWTEKGDTHGMHLLWPLISWGGADDPKRPHWWRILPFYGESIRPDRWENYTALWPFFHWGRERLDTEFPYDKFFLFPLVGWKTGGPIFSWTFLWPFFRHGHKVDGPAGAGKSGDFDYWDFPWPLFRILDDTWYRRNGIHQWWLTPFVASTRTAKQESLVLLYPLVWLRRFWNRVSDEVDTFILPFFWRSRIRYKKPERRGTNEKLEDDAFESAEDRRWRLFPLAAERGDRTGSWRFRALDPYPWEGIFARGVREAYDWIWTLVEVEGDARGNSSVRTFANVYTNRNFAGRRFQASVPFLFNFEAVDGGERTLRLFQFIPIRWGPGRR